MRYATVFLAAALLTIPRDSGDQPKGLADYYHDYFPIGVAVSIRNITGPDTALILREFNSLTPENAMKMGPIHPEENRYNWKDADAIVHFATVVSRYKGSIYAWDVVNEAIADDSTQFLRNSPWYRICGDEFIVKAFE